MPLARPSIVAGLALVLMETISDFGTVEYFALETLTLGVFNVWLGMNSLSGAAQISSVLFLIVILLLTLEYIARKRQRFYEKSSGQNIANPIESKGVSTLICLAICLIPLLLGFIIPVIVLLNFILSGFAVINFITIIYALNRTTAESSIFLNHLLNPLIFLGKQIGILIPFFILFFLMISKFKPKINLKDKKLIFLLAVNIAPLILIFLTSMIMGAKIRTMWMTPFYLFIGVFLIYLFQNKINLNKLKYFFTLFFILFIFSPIAYSYVSITQNNKRTDYPGKKIAKKVQEKWEANFKNKIGVVGGDHWHGGNLFYNLESKPKWDNIFESKKNPSIKNEEDGFVLIGDADILSNICKGVFFKVEKQGICMIGVKK